MNSETLSFLLSADGESLIDEAKSMDGGFLRISTALRKRFPVDAVNSALELIELRKRAARKFTLADRMFFTRESLEQSSGEVISSYRAERFVEGSHVLDLACGIGGDTIGLARRCIVTAVDNDPIRLEMARRNIDVYGLRDRVQFVMADVTQIPLDADAAFLDPSRRANGRRVKSLKEMSPSLDFIHALVERIPECAVKLSPAADDDELASLNAEIEFISESGECKEAVAWFGGLSRGGVSATVLPQRASVARGLASPAPVNPPAMYLYEPDSCVIRSHTVDELAGIIGAWRLDARIPYLSSDTLSITPFADAYEIVDSNPFNIKRLNAYLRDNDVGSVIIKKRGVPFEPEDVMKKLKLSGRREIILVFTRIGDKNWTLVCNRL